MRPDEYDLEYSREIEARLDRNEEKEPPWINGRHRRKEPRMYRPATSRIIHASPETNPSYMHPWVLPLPSFSGVEPVTLAVEAEHVELGYKLGAALPNLVPVFAAHDGACVYAGKCGDGYALCIDHPGGWSTQYGNLKHMFFVNTDRFRRRRKQRVRAGDAIGYATSPVRMRFTLAKLTDPDEGLTPVDPSSFMKQWLVLPCGSTTNAPARAITDLAA